MRSRSPIAAVLVAGLVLGGVVSNASAASAGLAGVRSTRVVQNGRRLQWTINLVHGFSHDGIASRARGVCLLLEARQSQAVVKSVCLAAGHGRGLSLVRASWHRGTAAAPRPLRGIVTRSGSDRVTASFTPTALGVPYRSLRWQVLSTATGPGCVTASGVRRPACAVFFPSRRHPLAVLHTPRLAGCTTAGPSSIYSGPTNTRDIALTFDDGPWGDPPTIDFVNELKRLDAVGTFFEIGDQLSEYDPTGSVERAMLANGDMIGDHTWTHPNMEALPVAAQTSELELTADAIRGRTGFTPCLWRPPYGTADPSLASLARGLGFLTVYWNDDTRDWALPGTSAIVSTALSEASNGGIIIMHFGGGPREETLAALPDIVTALRARGYRFVNLVQLLGLHEIWR
jgi:peptidoglycan/xylan/chitin deacetylase (PgdA/CDA1 family)